MLFKKCDPNEKKKCDREFDDGNTAARDNVLSDVNSVKLDSY